MKATTLLATALFLAAAGAPAGEDSAGAAPGAIAKALGLRGQRLEVLPPGVEFVAPLADGRVAVVVYNYELAFRRADGSAVLGGKILVGPDGASRRLFPSESAKLDQETAGGWGVVSTAFPRRFPDDFRGERHLVRGDIRAGLPCAPMQLLESPGSGQLLACLLGGMYRVVLEDAGGGPERRVRLDEVVPTGAYQCGTWYHYQGAGEHGSCEDFIAPDGRIWHISRYGVTRIEPPPEVRAQLSGGKK